MRASQTLLCFISLLQLYIFKKYDPTLEDSERKKKKKKTPGSEHLGGKRESQGLICQIQVPEEGPPSSHQMG